jgi:hypothetical protein
MKLAARSLTQSELGEVFQANPIREVDFEIRFSPRLRVAPEMWRFQEDLETEYPEVGPRNGTALVIRYYYSVRSSGFYRFLLSRRMLRPSRHTRNPFERFVAYCKLCRQNLQLSQDHFRAISFVNSRTRDFFLPESSSVILSEPGMWGGDCWRFQFHPRNFCRLIGVFPAAFVTLG